MEEYTIYTDGACDNMSQLDGGAWAFLDVRNGKVFNKGVGFQRIATNNQMELRAIFEAFLYVSPNSKVHIITDSKYCIGMLSQGWKPKANHALISRIKSIVEDKNLTVTFEWVKGHSGDYFNEMADTLANNEYQERTGKTLTEYHTKNDNGIDYKKELYEFYTIVCAYFNKCEILNSSQIGNAEYHTKLIKENNDMLTQSINKVGKLIADLE